MADRYFHVDVAFMHKATCDKLYEAFGWAGPMTFIALCSQAKTSSVPGVFIYENESIAWAKMGFEGRRPAFTLDEFLKVTGRIKQTSRTRVGRLTHVKLTQYGRWQKDGKRQAGRERMSRYRAQNERDTERTPGVTGGATEASQRTRSRTTPLPPVGKEKNHPHDCPHCGARQPSRAALTAHLEFDHPDTEAAA